MPDGIKSAPISPVMSPISTDHNEEIDELIRQKAKKQGGCKHLKTQKSFWYDVDKSSSDDDELK